MNSELLLAHFNRISDAPDAVPRLRTLILDLAVRGKIVSQNSNEELSSQLLERIQAEEKRRCKGMKNRKRQGAPSLPADEIPFELPRQWIWLRLSELGITQTGTTPSSSNPEYFGEYIPFIKPADLTGNIINYSGAGISKRGVEHSRLIPRHSVLMVCIGSSIGKVNVNDRDICCNQQINTVTPYLEHLAKFTSFALKASYFQKLIRANAGMGTLPIISKGKWEMLPIPLPSHSEQQRIVAKVDELMAQCDRLETAKMERENRRDKLAAASHHHLNNGANAGAFRMYADFCLGHLTHLTTRPDQIKQMRQTILNLAVRGRLVPQDPNEEPASELLRRIQVAEEQRVTKGKSNLKRTLPPLDTTRRPFELPSGWTWARFPELGMFGRGKSKHRPRNDHTLFGGGTHLLVQTGDVARSNGLISTFTNKYNDIGLAQSAKWPKGTLCITIAANIADSGILTFDACFPDSVVGFIPADVFPNARYFEYFVRTAKADLLKFAPATAQKNINLEILNAVLIPLPPLAEQQRIVTRVDELMDLCGRLEKQLIEGDAKSNGLLKAVLHHALNDASETSTAATLSLSGALTL
jgi:type I restriction enzyme, S subunit